MRGEFYKMDFRAWNVGTVDLTLEQEGAYLRLCHAMYDVGGPVPNSTRFLQGIFRCGNTKAAALVGQLIAAGKIAVTGDGRLINHRVTEELAARERVSAVRRVAGERGGSAPRATADRVPTDPRANADRPPTEGEANGSKPLKTKDLFEAIAPRSESRGEEIRGEKIEQKKDKPSSAGEAPKSEDQKSPRGSFLPTDWQPSDAGWTFAIAELGDEHLARRELMKFRNFWFGKVGEAGRKRDWDATWRNWVMKEADNGAGPRNRSHVGLASSGGRSSGTVNASVSTAVARHAARLGIGPGGGQDDRGSRDPADHGPRRDDPKVEDAEWSPARGHYAAH
jgi:uncharacterized protein YdaU (DUF1376 family)